MRLHTLYTVCDCYTKGVGFGLCKMRDGTHPPHPRLGSCLGIGPTSNPGRSQENKSVQLLPVILVHTLVVVFNPFWISYGPLCGWLCIFPVKLGLIIQSLSVYLPANLVCFCKIIWGLEYMQLVSWGSIIQPANQMRHSMATT